MNDLHPLLAATALSIISCSSRTQDDPPQGAWMPLGPLTESANAVTAGQTGFALALHAQLAAESPLDNIVTSPWSVWTALAMVHEGARGSTREELGELLGLAADADTASIHAALAELRMRLTHATKKHGEIRLADAVWARDGLPLAPGIAASLEDGFDAVLERLDFAKDAAGAAERINGWVSEKTNGRIDDLIDPDTLGPATEILVTDAIYFKAGWLTPFDEERTGDRVFTKADGTQIQVPFMHLSEAEKFRIGKVTDADAGVDATAVELPYIGESFSFLAIVPGAPDGLDELESWLTTESVTRTIASMRERKVVVSMPKLKLEPRVELVEPLKALGLSAIFDAGLADLSGLAPDVPLVVDAVTHASFLEVNEEGTEAAAATAIGMVRASIPERILLDRPFLFMIRERSSGTVMFLGRIMDPR